MAAPGLSSLVPDDAPCSLSEIATLRFFKNMTRTAKLLRYALTLQFSDKPLSADLLRSCVVMLHSTFEDYCRTLARERLMIAGPDAFDPVPFPGQLTPAKMPLKYLVQYRDKSVVEVLAMALDEYLATYTLNNVGDLVRLLQRMGLDPSPIVAPIESDLAWLIARRHRIVHEADMPRPPDSAGPASFDVSDAHRLGTVFGKLPLMVFEINTVTRTAIMSASGSTACVAAFRELHAVCEEMAKEFRTFDKK